MFRGWWMEGVVETRCPGREGCGGSPHRQLGAGSLVDVCPDPWGHLDSALGCHTPESGPVAFLPSLLLVSAGDAAEQQQPELCLEPASPWHYFSFLLSISHCKLSSWPYTHLPSCRSICPACARTDVRPLLGSTVLQGKLLS